jgi:hypothetical protein
MNYLCRDSLPGIRFTFGSVLSGPSCASCQHNSMAIDIQCQQLPYKEKTDGIFWLKVKIP